PDDALARLLADAAVDELHAPLLVHEYQPVAGARGHHLQQFLRGAHRFLRARLLADVDGDTDDTQHLAGRVADHAGRIEQRDVVSIAMTDPVLQRHHGFGIAVEPLPQQVLVVRVNQRGPIGRARQFRRGVAEHPFDAFVARAAGFGVDVVDHAAQLARHGTETLVGGRQRGFADLARGDVDHQADHAFGRPVGQPVDDVRAVQRPVPAAVGVAEAVFGLQLVGGRIDAPQALAEAFDLPVRVGAELLAPAARVGAPERRVDAEHAVVPVGVVGHAGFDIPVPHA